LLVVILVVVVFGSQLPKIARNAGMAGREFRKAQREAEADAERDQVSRAAAAVTPVPPPVGPAVPSQQASITLTRSELDSLLQAREKQVKEDCASPGT
jgi:TatA/E family protein of Tat protein translocase